MYNCLTWPWLGRFDESLVGEGALSDQKEARGKEESGEDRFITVSIEFGVQGMFDDGKCPQSD